MGKLTHIEPRRFASDLNAYLTKVLADNGREDLSGRWLEQITDQARRYDYWSKIIKDTRAMTTNDVQVLAEAFGVSPFTWVDYARDHAAGRPTPILKPYVGGSIDDLPEATVAEVIQLRRDRYLAALRGRDEADIPPAD